MVKINISLYLNNEKNTDTKKVKLKELMTNTPDDNLICPICDDVFLNPVHCVKCNLFICEHCFKETNRKYVNMKLIQNQMIIINTLHHQFQMKSLNV